MKSSIYFSSSNSRTSGGAGQVFSIDATKKFQEILGFGGAFTEATGYNLQKMSKPKQEEIMALYFGNASASNAYSIGRVHMNSCDFCLNSYSCDDTAGDYNLTGCFVLFFLLFFFSSFSSFSSGPTCSHLLT